MTPVKPLDSGSRVAVISPAAPTLEPADAFEQGVALLKQYGFEPVVFPYANAHDGYLAGRDEERLSDLVSALRDPEIDGILCTRGGYGCMKLLSHLPWDMLRGLSPKVFIGFSDVTALHVAFYQELGWQGFYGPMLTSNLIHPDEAQSGQWLWPMVQDALEYPYTVPNRDPYHVLFPGVVEAPVFVGNFSLLAALCGSRWQPKPAGHILVIEDWHEQFYTLDRKFQQLKLAGVLDDVKGLLFADMSEIEPRPEFDLVTLLKRLTADLGIPAGYGYSIGHGPVTATVPMGCPARFDANAGTLTLLESVFRN